MTLIQRTALKKAQIMKKFGQKEKNSDAVKAIQEKFERSTRPSSP